MVNEFIGYLVNQMGVSANTQLTYRQYVVLFQKWLAGRPETPENAVAYIATFQNLSSRSVVASALRAYFEWRDPTHPLRVRVKTSKSLPKPISVSDLWLMLRHMKGDIRLIVLLMAFAGLRVTEACELRTSALAVEAMAIRVTGKGNKERIVSHIPKALFALMQNHIQGRRRGFPLFPGRGERTFLARATVEHALGDVSRRLGSQESLHPHRLRHFYATWLYALTRDPFLVARQLGHTNIQTTMGYADLVQVPPHIRSLDDLWKEVVE